MQYHNHSCISCGEQFQETDDIVVCPECGTPYHRACWQKEGKCINQTLHDARMSWQETQKPVQEIPDHEVWVCAACGHENETTSPTCSGCGKPQNIPGEQGIPFRGRTIYPNAPMLGLNPNEEVGGVSIGEMSAYVGKNHIYYLPIFLAMQESGRKTSFNILGLVCPSLFFANRKQWLPALGCVLLQILFRLPILLVTLTDMEQYAYLAETLHLDGSFFQTLYDICLFGDLAFTLLVGMFANFIYLRSAKHHIAKVRKKLGERPLWERYAALKAQGGTSPVGVLSICAVWFLAALAGSTFVLLFL